MKSVGNVGCGKCRKWKMKKKHKSIVKRKIKNPMLDNLKSENL